MRRWNRRSILMVTLLIFAALLLTWFANNPHWYRTGVFVELTFDSPFDLRYSGKLVIRNNSGKTIQFPNPASAKFYQDFGCDFIEKGTGRTFEVRRKVKLMPHRCNNEPYYISLAPHSEFELPLNFLARAYGESFWTNCPSPNMGRLYEIVPVFPEFCGAYVIRSRSQINVQSISEIHEYVDYNFDEVAKEMLGRRPHLVRRYELERNSLLIIATKRCNYPMAKWLLQNGADVNAQDEDGQTAIFHVGDPRLAKLLLDHGARMSLVRSRDRNGNATWESFAFDALQDRLLTTYPNPPANPKQLAGALKVLVKRGAIPNLVYAIYFNDVDMAAQIASEVSEAGFERQNQLLEHNPIELAIKMGRDEMVQVFINEGLFDTDIPFHDNYSTQRALVKTLRQPKLLGLFLESGASVTKPTNQQAIKTSYPYGDSSPILFYAAELGCQKTVELLLDYGADPFAQDPRYGRFPIEVAIVSGQTKNALALLNHTTFENADESIKQRVLDAGLAAVCYMSFEKDGLLNSHTWRTDPGELIEQLVWMGGNVNRTTYGKTMLGLVKTYKSRGAVRVAEKLEALGATVGRPVDRRQSPRTAASDHQP